MTRPVRVDAERARRVIRTAGQIGPYFLVGVGPREGFVPAADFYHPRALGDLLTAVGERIGTSEIRVAAASLDYELAERIWSIVLACWQLDRVVVDLDSMTCHAAPNGRLRLRLGEPGAVEHVGADPHETAALIAADVVDHLRAAHAGLRAATGVADGLLWGNAAAALALVARALFSRNGDETLTAVTAALLAAPPLAGRLRGDITTGIVRRTCCLHYRTSARRTCGDCPLTGSVAARRRA